MSQILSLDRDISINDSIFFSKIWDAFFTSMKKKENLVLDFRNIKFIRCTVVTKLCCLGEIAKEKNIQIQLFPSIELALYLADMDFWRIAEEHSLFVFDERYLNISPFQRKVTSALFCLEKESLRKRWEKRFEFAEWVDEKRKYEYYVTAELTGENNTENKGAYTVNNIPKQCQAVLETISGFIGYSEYTCEDNIMRPIIQLVHNSVWHSHGICYFLTQTSMYSGRDDSKWKGIDVSVSDTGCGLYNSLVEKLDSENCLKFYRKEEFLKISNKFSRDYCSILEALFYREKSETRGLYDIITDLANEPAEYSRTLRIINGNVELKLNEGPTKNKRICKLEDISQLVKNGAGVIDKRRKNHVSQLQDIGFSFCVDISISIPIIK